MAPTYPTDHYAITTGHVPCRHVVWVSSDSGQYRSSRVRATAYDAYFHVAARNAASRALLTAMIERTKSFDDRRNLYAPPLRLPIPPSDVRLTPLHLSGARWAGVPP